jgi:hypothetical protein
MKVVPAWWKLVALTGAVMAAVVAWSCGSSEEKPPFQTPPKNPPCTQAPPPNCQELPPGKVPAEITTCLYVQQGGEYFADQYVHIFSDPQKKTHGELHFLDPGRGKRIDFRAQSILVEAGGVLEAGTDACHFGESGGRLSIGLFGDDPTAEGTVGTKASERLKGIECKTGGGSCFPEGLSHDSNYCTGGDATDPLYPCNGAKPSKDPKNSLLEHYDPMNFDGSAFGYKVLGVAFGGSVRFFGSKGTLGAGDPKVDPAEKHCAVPDKSDLTLDSKEMQAWAKLTGSSWVRLAGQKEVSLDDGRAVTELTLDRVVQDWEVGDQIVVGTTDWYPAHYEQREVIAVEHPSAGTKLTVAKLQYPHAHEIFDVSDPA